MKGLTIPAFLSGLSALIRVGASQCFDGSTTYQEALSVPPSVVQYSSCGHAADGPKVYPIDAVSYDWWYFDAVSSDGKEALTVIFFTASPAGFPSLASVPNPLNVAIAGTFANGTTAGGSALATSVTVDVVGNGASGNWTDSGCAFTGTPDLSRYVVTVGNPSLGISGTLELVSVSLPFHSMLSPLIQTARSRTLPMQPSGRRRERAAHPARRLGQRDARGGRDGRLQLWRLRDEVPRKRLPRQGQSSSLP